MRLFRSLKGDHPTSVGGPAPSDSHEPTDSYAPPSGPPPSYEEQGTHSSYSDTNQSEYAPPAGLPPSHRLHESPFNSPRHTQTEYVPPSGPPPSHIQATNEPAPYHDWTTVPDTALLPPPPLLGHKKSPASNAKLSDADRAHDWCKRNPLIKPHIPTSAHTESVKKGDVALVKPREYIGNLSLVPTGSWRGLTRSASKDTCVMTSSPLYFAAADSPFQTEVSKTIYFEVKILDFGRGADGEASSMALGFCAIPYPTWRMPGWERGSLAVHADDGRRYVNDTFGGKDFTSPIRAGETVGIGMTFAIPETPHDYTPSPSEGVPLKAEIFFTRNGKRDGGWDLHEELDANDEFGILGLDGQYDLYGAIGTFGKVGFETSFNGKDWLWQPNQHGR